MPKNATTNKMSHLILEQGGHAAHTVILFYKDGFHLSYLFYIYVHNLYWRIPSTISIFYLGGF